MYNAGATLLSMAMKGYYPPFVRADGALEQEENPQGGDGGPVDAA